MRILHVVGTSRRRGAETFALELAAALDACGHDDSVVALGPGPDGGSDPELPALTKRHVGFARSPPPTRRWRLRRRSRSRPSSTSCSHTVRPRPGRQPSCVGRNGPLMVWKRISPAAWRPVQRRWWRAIARRVDAVVALTPQLEDEMRHLGYEGPVWLIRNARASGALRRSRS